MMGLSLQNVECLTFSQRAVWFYKPSLIKVVEDFMKDKHVKPNGISDKINWEGFFYFTSPSFYMNRIRTES
jgi:hypothetical protein